MIKKTKKLLNVEIFEGGGMKQHMGKLDFNVCSPQLTYYYALVGQYGLEKGYGKNSWKKVPIDKYYAAQARHKNLFDLFMDGDPSGREYDEESGYHHLLHWFWNVFAIVYLELKEKDLRKHTNKKN